MNIGELTVDVELKRRSLVSRIVRFPFVFKKHYDTMRKHGNGVILSLCASWLLSGHVVVIGKTRADL